MFKFIIQFLIMLILLIRNRKNKGGWFTPSGVLIMIYAICSLMAIFVIMSGEYISPKEDYYWLPMLVFDIFIVLYLYPFRRFNEVNVDTIKLPSRQFLDVFSTIIIILSLYSIIYYFGTVRYIFSLSDLGAARNNRYVEGEFIEIGVLNTIASVSAANYVFAIVLYFIYKIIGNNKKRCFLLFISSFSNAIHVLGFVGRDGIVFWFFTFLFCYAFFRPFLIDIDRKGIGKIIAMGTIILLIPFFMITISRFGESYDRGTSGSIVSYLGQSFVQGPLFFGLEQKPISIGSSFPLFSGLFSGNNQNIAVVSTGEWITYKFSTFIINLYISLGFYGLIFITLLMLLFFGSSFGRAKNVINFGQLSIYILYFQVIGEGVFYFCHYTRGGNLFIISTLVLSAFFSLFSNEKNNIVFTKVA